MDDALGQAKNENAEGHQTVKALEARLAELEPGSALVDLGSGRGVALMAAVGLGGTWLSDLFTDGVHFVAYRTDKAFKIAVGEERCPADPVTGDAYRRPGNQEADAAHDRDAAAEINPQHVPGT